MTKPNVVHDRTPRRFQHAALAEARFGSLATDLMRALRRVDPLADEAALALRVDGPRGFAELDRRLSPGRKGHVAPAVEALLESVETVPTWLDRARADAGGAVFIRTGILGGIVLGARSLALGYASPAGNKPLVKSGRLGYKAGRRLAETSRFVHAVCSPGGMLPGGEGFAITVKVRLMHAHVRLMLNETGWPTDDWGEPINQHDMCGTILLFSLAALEGVRRFGCDVSVHEAEDLMHLWRYVGHVIGVEPQLLPTSVEHARQLEAIIELTEGEPDEDSRQLLDALMWAGVQGAPTEAARRRALMLLPMGYGFAWGLLGPERARQLGVPETGWNTVVPAVRRIVRWVEVARRLHPTGNRIAFDRGMAYWERAVTQGLGRNQATFAPPTDLPGRVTFPTPPAPAAA